MSARETDVSVASVHSFSHTSSQQVFIEHLQCAEPYARCSGHSSFLPTWNLQSSEG